MKNLLPFLGLFYLCHGAMSAASLTPQQVHLAFGDNQYEMTVTWNTVSETSDSIVEYGLGGLMLRETGNATQFKECRKQPCNVQYVHRVRLRNLVPASTYMYHCGSSDGGWSPVFLFTTPPEESLPWAPRLLVYGDMGSVNAQSLPRMEQEVARGDVDAILHVGDFAYDMDSENGAVGDEFMRQIESLAAYVPYMTCPGNHEERNNFSEYKSRFSMPGGTQNMMYSFNLGPIHFISISTEFYYFLEYGVKLSVGQYYWLEKDLQEATKPEVRSKRPWIVAYGHRPMYCSNGGFADCNNYNSRVRTGLPFLGLFGLEDIFYKYGVDLMIWGHEHSYERTWPLYNHTVLNGSVEEPYRNPKGPVHIVTGSAGCKERIAPFVLPMPEWSAFRNTDYGYTRMHFKNASHVHIEQVSDDQGGKVVDSIWLIKDKHGSYEDLQYDTTGRVRLL